MADNWTKVCAGIVLSVSLTGAGAALIEKLNKESPNNDNKVENFTKKFHFASRANETTTSDGFGVYHKKDAFSSVIENKEPEKPTKKDKARPHSSEINGASLDNGAEVEINGWHIGDTKGAEKFDMSKDPFEGMLGGITSKEKAQINAFIERIGLTPEEGYKFKVEFRNQLEKIRKEHQAYANKHFKEHSVDELQYSAAENTTSGEWNVESRRDKASSTVYKFNHEKDVYEDNDGVRVDFPYINVDFKNSEPSSKNAKAKTKQNRTPKPKVPKRKTGDALTPKTLADIKNAKRGRKV